MPSTCRRILPDTCKCSNHQPHGAYFAREAPSVQSTSPTTAPVDLEKLRKKRAAGRLRTKQCRDRAKERADSRIARSLTKLTAGARGTAGNTNTIDKTQTNSNINALAPDDLADATAKVLLQRGCERWKINIDTVLAPIGQALQAQRVMKLGRVSTLQADWQTRLRASEQGYKILESIGMVPSTRFPERVAGNITVNLVVMPEDAATRTITQDPEDTHAE